MSTQQIRKVFSSVIAGFILLLPVSALHSQGQSGYIISNPVPDSDGVIRILLYHDMEGLSGQDDWRSIFVFYPEFFDEGRKLLTADVNVVIDGLFAGEADEVHVVDTHGSGASEPELILEQLDKRALFLRKGEDFEPYVDLVEPGVYDAVAAVGMHSRTGGGGFCAHTRALGTDFILNGMSINETELVAFSWGRVDVPVIFVSGDDRLGEQLKDKPWIEYVTVKQATSAFSAKLRPVDVVHNEMWSAARRAVENLTHRKAIRLTTPIEASIRAVPPASLEVFEGGVAGIRYHDNTVTFLAKDFDEAFQGLTVFMSVATKSYSSILREVVSQEKNGQEIMQKYIDSVLNRWLETESRE